MKTVDPVWMIDKQEGVLSLQAVQLSQLTKHRLSNNVGSVKSFLSVPVRALEGARHFALVEDVPIQPKLARNHRSGLELSPTHASLRSQPRP